VHTLTVANRHLPDISVYLLNAAKPNSDSIRISSQERNKDQSSGEIHFEVKTGQVPVVAASRKSAALIVPPK